MIARVSAWAFSPAPLARITILRYFIYLFVILDLLWISKLGFSHGDTPQLYKPILLREFLPTPSPVYVRVLAAVVIVSALLAARGNRVAGWVCFVGMLDWWSNVFSYGKIDHDHFALVVALAVLPTVGGSSLAETGSGVARSAFGAERSGSGVERSSEAAAWALRCIQLGVVATYFLSAIAKVRFGGWGWPSSAIFTWAFVRRGTDLAQLMLNFPVLVKASQWGLFLAEAFSPLLLFVRPCWRYLGIAGFAGFHFVTWLLIEIHFLPLAICLLAFLPLERVRLPRLALGGLLRRKLSGLRFK
jgi:hypothetical protein